jgi:ABC-type bacteriocin/lantibiotic exporter with double-glycine peptidase domain
MGVVTNLTNWDPVAWMSILMVVLAVAIVIFIGIKVRDLMKRDAEAHKDQTS